VEDEESGRRVEGTMTMRTIKRKSKKRSNNKPKAKIKKRVPPQTFKQPSGRPSDEQKVLALHEAGDKALMSEDLDVLTQIFADDYVQYNESGQAFTKKDVLNNFRSGAIRYPSIISTGRVIRIFGDTAVVHGSESDEVEANGRKFSVRYVYLDVLRKRDGEWKLVASQLARKLT
jgi:ketosteroid isomerase-like protein